MKQKTRRNIRRWTGMMLALCIFAMMMPVAALAETPTSLTLTYTGGVEDNTYTGENALGDIVLADPVVLEDGKE